MELNSQKIVDFVMYCHRCKFITLPENEEPCAQCITTPVNTNSRRPIKYKESEKQIEGEESK